jgi:phosphatidylinositol alpha 1,6-mannosyltransferase
VRVAIVAETFRPAVNGVSNSVVRVLEHLGSTGHEALVVAPAPGPDSFDGVPVVRARSFRPPMYRSVHVGRPRTPLAAVLREFDPDVVHLASPALLGHAGARAAAELGVPAVAVFQTDLAGYVSRYHLRPIRPLVWSHLRRLHGQCALTLAPSSASAWMLARNGIGPVARWGRGVDLDAFAPRHRSSRLRRILAPNGEVLVGFIGRLAPEKRVHLLGPITRLPGVRVVVVGDGPSRSTLQRRLPGAVFLGFRRGRELSEAFASLDVFVHPGAEETFGQAVQEALASGVPAVAPAAGGPLDLVRHGENGWLWAGDDPGLLCDQVASLCAEPELRARMGLRARISVLDRTWQRVGDDLLGHYRTVIAGALANRVSPARTPVPGSGSAPVAASGEAPSHERVA